eukprot:TRINITY_DN13919_c0_g1_i1.p1 TRINITY_DN13919_c0_g1~~TRINITY_DN13919_c0_g1_i1.p1  ORF type:complete len:1057 (+),score=459.92 TRINITY_DN13919_c0_g1_i1:75-3245(+)
MESLIQNARAKSQGSALLNGEPAAVQYLKTLPSNTQRFLDSDDSQPFENEEFLKVLESQKDLLDHRLTQKNSANSSLLGVNLVGKKSDTETAISVLETLEDTLKLLYKKKNARLNVSTLKDRPRFCRIADRLGLSEKEVVAFELMLVGSLSYGRGISEIMDFAEMNWKERVAFLDSKRTYCKENYFEYIDTERPFTSNWSFTHNVSMALAGMKLSEEQLLKLDGTVISQVIEDELPEEERNKLKSSSASAIKNRDGESDLEGEDDLVFVDGQNGEGEAPKDASDDETPKAEEEEPAEVVDEPEEFHEFLKKQIEIEKDHYANVKPVSAKEGDQDDEIPIAPYSSDLDYLQTEAKRIAGVLQVENLEKQIQQQQSSTWGRAGDDSQSIIRLRQLKAKTKAIVSTCQKRLKLTIEAGPWIPRMERMVTLRGLDDFERHVLLTLIVCNFSTDVQSLGYSRGIDVGTVLRSYAKGLEEQINKRKYFYKGSKMIKEGIIRISGGSALDDDLITAYLTVDRRMLEFVMGIDSEFSELVEGSHLYFPKVKLDQVILSPETKKLILNTVENFEGFKRARKRMGFEETLTYGSGIVMLFFGASGTGKTMVANAIANHMNKKLLLINFPSLGRMSGGENLKFIFREAKINDAILFFDECESIFESRDMGGYEVNLLLTEIERHDGLVIMATNRAYDLDEAMHRRVTLAIEFIKPDPILRESIWKANIPSGLVLDANVNLKDLAMNFELTGGFIKNAILSALSIAVARDGEKSATVKQEDLEAGARLQLRGRLRMINFEHRVVPTRGLESLVLAKTKVALLQSIVDYEKARQILFGQWGFDRVMGADKANSVLFYGPPGTGKTLAAEAVAFSTGKPLKFVNTGELISKWVGDTPKNINAIFEEAAANDAVLFFDEADAVFGKRTAVSSSTDRYANVDTGSLLYHIEHYKGIVILSTNLREEIDAAFFRRIKFVVEFTVPGQTERAVLWKSLIPSECPVDPSLQFGELSRKYEFTGGQIKSSVIRAASRAALREDKKKMITQEDLDQACKEELDKTGNNDSAGASLYA